MYNIGLWDVLEPAFEDRYGVDLDVITGGTGQAIEAGKRGDVDVLTLHDRAREEEFVAQGYGLQRHPIAYNSFIIVGPPNDPAGIRGMEPEVAFLEIMEQGIANPGNVKFVSRGDRSGTHSREMLIWQLAGLDYESVRSSGRWYIEAGGGMGAILRLAHEKSAYTLAVSSAYIAFRDKLDLASLVDWRRASDWRAWTGERNAGFPGGHRPAPERVLSHRRKSGAASGRQRGHGAKAHRLPHVG